MVKEIDDAVLNYEMQVLISNYETNNLSLTKKIWSFF